ncbi:MAG: hypothetical protein CMF51_02070 [Legionellales bacterium]|nr:hypothetical protein [Legionellales bacterium]
MKDKSEHTDEDTQLSEPKQIQDKITKELEQTAQIRDKNQGKLTTVRLTATIGLISIAGPIALAITNVSLLIIGLSAAFSVMMLLASATTYAVYRSNQTKIDSLSRRKLNTIEQLESKLEAHTQVFSEEFYVTDDKTLNQPEETLKSLSKLEQQLSDDLDNIQTIKQSLDHSEFKQFQLIDLNNNLDTLERNAQELKKRITSFKTFCTSQKTLTPNRLEFDQKEQKIKDSQQFQDFSKQLNQMTLDTTDFKDLFQKADDCFSPPGHDPAAGSRLIERSISERLETLLEGKTAHTAKTFLKSFDQAISTHDQTETQKCFNNSLRALQSTEFGPDIKNIRSERQFNSALEQAIGYFDTLSINQDTPKTQVRAQIRQYNNLIQLIEATQTLKKAGGRNIQPELQSKLNTLTEKLNHLAPCIQEELTALDTPLELTMDEFLDHRATLEKRLSLLESLQGISGLDKLSTLAGQIDARLSTLRSEQTQLQIKIAACTDLESLNSLESKIRESNGNARTRLDERKKVLNDFETIKTSITAFQVTSPLNTAQDQVKTFQLTLNQLKASVPQEHPLQTSFSQLEAILNTRKAEIDSQQDDQRMTVPPQAVSASELSSAAAVGLKTVTSNAQNARRRVTSSAQNARRKVTSKALEANKRFKREAKGPRIRPTRLKP